MAVQLGMLGCFPSSERLHSFPPYWLKVGVQESWFHRRWARLFWRMLIKDRVHRMLGGLGCSCPKLPSSHIMLYPHEITSQVSGQA